MQKKYLHKKIGYYHSGKTDNFKVLNSKVRLIFFVSLEVSLLLAGYTY